MVFIIQDYEVLNQTKKNHDIRGTETLTERSQL